MKEENGEMSRYEFGRICAIISLVNGVYSCLGLIPMLMPYLGFQFALNGLSWILIVIAILVGYRKKLVWISIVLSLIPLVFFGWMLFTMDLTSATF